MIVGDEKDDQLFGDPQAFSNFFSIPSSVLGVKAFKVYAVIDQGHPLGWDMIMPDDIILDHLGYGDDPWAALSPVRNLLDQATHPLFGT